MSGSHRTPPRRRFSLSRRGKIVAVATTAAVAGATIGFFALFPRQAPAFVRSAVRGAMESVGIMEEPPPPPEVCPLTGEEVPDEPPARPALAVKIDNAPSARPQAGLNQADVVVEEPVEGGYTRFIAIFHCGKSDRVGPVRSVRTTDPKFLRQLGSPLFAYSGGVSSIVQQLREAGLTDVGIDAASEVYTFDSSRAAPHNAFASTADLWKAGRKTPGPPSPLFAYADEWEGRSRRVATIQVPFSSASNVVWTWDRGAGAWMRSYGGVPDTLEDGAPVAATNLVVQVVEVTDSNIVDAAGNPSPEVELTGSGRAYLFRDGRVILGRWEREDLEDVTRFVTNDGDEITLAPGRTWVQLVPSFIEVSFAKPGA